MKKHYFASQYAIKSSGNYISSINDSPQHQSGSGRDMSARDFPSADSHIKTGLERFIQKWGNDWRR